MKHSPREDSGSRRSFQKDGVGWGWIWDAETPDLSRSQGVTQMGREEIPLGFNRLPWVFSSFQNLCALLIETSFLSEFISKIFCFLFHFITLGRWGAVSPASIFISGTGLLVPAVVMVPEAQRLRPGFVSHSVLICSPIPPAVRPWGCFFASNLMGHLRQALCNTMSGMNNHLLSLYFFTSTISVTTVRTFFFLQYLVGLSKMEVFFGGGWYLFMGAWILNVALIFVMNDISLIPSSVLTSSQEAFPLILVCSSAPGNCLHPD